MNELIQKVVEWPIIIQGALGSGLFWLILYLGQKVSVFLSDRLSNYSIKKRISRLRIEVIKYKITLNNQPHRSSLFGLLIYRAIGKVTIGLVWLTLGLAFESIVPIFGIVGYLGALYHLFNAWQMFRPLDTDVDREKRIEELTKEIDELEKHNNKIQPTAEGAAD